MAAQSLMAAGAIALSVIAARPLALVRNGLADTMAAAASIAMIVAFVRLAYLIGWWCIPASLASCIAGALAMRPAYRLGGRGDLAVYQWVGYIVPLALTLAVLSWLVFG